MIEQEGKKDGEEGVFARWCEREKHQWGGPI